MPRILYLAVFLSGFASLGYELCWIRKGAIFMGATSQALSVVVAVFIGGLAWGAYLMGKWSKRIPNLLFGYGLLELGIGLVAIATPSLFDLARSASSHAHPWVGTNQWFHLGLRSMMIAALLFPVCMLMGGTLPLLCQFAVHERNIDDGFVAGILYATNTTGAFLGCMVCGCWLLPRWGIDHCIRFNALLNLSAGLAAIYLARGMRTSPPATMAAPVPAPTPWDGTSRVTASRRFVQFCLFFGSGFAALGYEILWVRFLSLIIHNTVYTCIFTLGAILLGIAIGGMVITVAKVDRKQDALLFGIANLFIAFSVLLVLVQPLAAWEWIRDTQSIPKQALLCMLIILLPSIASGISFPLAYRMLGAHAINSGRDFGLLTAINMVGGIAGALLTGFLLLPRIGMYSTMLILTCSSLAIGAYAISTSNRLSRKQRGALAFGAAAGWAGIALFTTTRLPEDFLNHKKPIIEFTEGQTSFISVIERSGQVTLEMDRMWQGERSKGHQIMAAHIPMILHQEPKQILVVGMGTGQTASRFLMYDIDRLDCVEIESELPDLLKRHFDAAWLNDPRTHVIADDGRNFISSSRSAYDIVSIEVGQSFRPQIASFYTVDFYREVQKRLTKRGLACQFVPVGFFTVAEFQSVVRSFLEVFPQATLWFNKYSELILIGNATRQPRLDLERLETIQRNQILRSDLEYSFERSPRMDMNDSTVFAANFLMGPGNLSKLSTNAPLLTDDRPILEYQAARNKYSPVRFRRLIENNLESPSLLLVQKVSSNMDAKILSIRKTNLNIAMN